MTRMDVSQRAQYGTRMPKPGYQAINIYTTPDVHIYIKRLARAKGVSMTQLCSVALMYALPLIASGDIKIGDQDDSAKSEP